MKTPLTEFYEALNELDLHSKEYQIINKAALKLANNAFKQGRDVTVEIYTDSE